MWVRLLFSKLGSRDIMSRNRCLSMAGPPPNIGSVKSIFEVAEKNQRKPLHILQIVTIFLAFLSSEVYKGHQTICDYLVFSSQIHRSAWIHHISSNWDLFNKSRDVRISSCYRVSSWTILPNQFKGLNLSLISVKVRDKLFVKCGSRWMVSAMRENFLSFWWWLCKK